MYMRSFDFRKIAKYIKKENFQVSNNMRIYTFRSDPNKVKYIIWKVTKNNKSYRFGLAPIRVIRVPRLQIPLSQLTDIKSNDSASNRQKFLQEFDQILSALNELRVPLLTKIAIRKKETGEIIYLIYSPRAVSNKSEIDALNKLEERRQYVIQALKSRFRQIVLGALTVDEVQDIFTENGSQYYGLLTGIPTRAGTEEMPIKQMEAALRAALGNEANISIILEPVEKKTIVDALTRLRREFLTPFASNRVGTDGWSFYITLPLTFFTSSNISSTQGYGRSFTTSLQHAKSLSESIARSHVRSFSIQRSQSVTHGSALSRSVQESTAMSNQLVRSHQITEGRSFSETHGRSWSLLEGQSETISEIIQRGHTIGRGFAQTRSHSITESQQLSHIISQGESIVRGQSLALQEGYTRMQSETRGYNETWGNAFSRQISQQTHQSISRSTGFSRSTNFVQGQTYQRTTSESFGRSFGWNRSFGGSESLAKTQNITIGRSHVVNRGWNFARTQSSTLSRTHTTGRTQSYGGSVSYYNHLATRSLSYGENWVDSWLRDYNMYARNVSEGVNFGGMFGGVMATDYYASNANRDPAYLRALKDIGAFFGSDTQISTTSELKFQPFGMGTKFNISVSVTPFRGSYNWSNAKTYYGMVDPTKGYYQYSQSHSINRGEVNSYYYDPYGGIPRVTGENWGYSNSISDAISRAYGSSVSVGNSYGVQDGYSRAISNGITQTMGRTWSSGESSAISHNTMRGEAFGYSQQVGRGFTQNETISNSMGRSFGESYGRTESYGYGINYGKTLGESYNKGITRGSSVNIGQTQTESLGRTYGKAETFGTAETQSVNESWSESVSKGRALTRSVQVGRVESVAQTRGVSQAKSRGESRGVSTTQGRAVGNTETENIAYLTGLAYASGNSYGVIETNGRILSISRGSSRGSSFSDIITRSLSQAISGGISPSLGFSHTRQWENAEITGILSLLKVHELRLDKGKNEGMWLTSVIISSKTKKELRGIAVSLESALKGPLGNPESIEFFEIDDDKVRDILRKNTLIARVPKIPRIDGWDGFGVDRFQFATLLNTYEVTSLTHLPTEPIPGITVAAEDIPLAFSMNCPPEFIESNEPKVSYGWIINLHTGTPLGVKLEVPISKMEHHLIVGTTRSGKTNIAMYLISQLVELGYDIIVLDWKHTWRKLLNVVSNPERVRVFTLSKYDVAPLLSNPLRPPVIRYSENPNERRVVNPTDWAEVIAELFAYAYAPFPRSKSIVRYEIDELYRQNGVFESHGDPNFRNYPTMHDLCEAIDRRINRTNVNVAGRGELESLNAIKSRIWQYARTNDILHIEFGNHRVGIPIESLWTSGSITVIESSGISGSHKQFILSWLVSAIYMYYTSLGRPRERPLIVVLEEANHMIPPETILQSVHIIESIWETMFREIGEYNVWLWAIGQLPSRLPKAVLGNTPFKVVLNLATSGTESKGDVQIMLEQISMDPRWDHRHVGRFITRMPKGWAITKISGVSKQEYMWPYLISVPKVVDVDVPSDEEIRNRMSDIIRSLAIQ